MYRVKKFAVPQLKGPRRQCELFISEDIPVGANTSVGESEVEDTGTLTKSIKQRKTVKLAPRDHDYALSEKTMVRAYSKIQKLSGRNRRPSRPEIFFQI